MPKPPSVIFPKATNAFASTRQIVQKNYVKYFLIFYLISELITYAIDHFYPTFYFEFGFNLMTQIQLFILFIFLLRFNFCHRNKVIIYFLLVYFIASAIIPFFFVHEFYLSVMKNISVVLLSGLLILTVFKNEK
jgi:hypothetical protein